MNKVCHLIKIVFIVFIVIKPKRISRFWILKRQWKIIENLAKDIDLKLKKIDKFKSLKNMSYHIRNKMQANFLGQSSSFTSQKFQQIYFNRQWLFATDWKKTQLRNFTIYPGFANWCSWGEIDLSQKTLSAYVKK